MSVGTMVCELWEFKKKNMDKVGKFFFLLYFSYLVLFNCVYVQKGSTLTADDYDCTVLAI